MKENLRYIVDSSVPAALTLGEKMRDAYQNGKSGDVVLLTKEEWDAWVNGKLMPFYFRGCDEER